jgi:hypothetical protein
MKDVKKQKEIQSTETTSEGICSLMNVHLTLNDHQMINFTIFLSSLEILEIFVAPLTY